MFSVHMPSQMALSAPVCCTPCTCAFGCVAADKGIPVPKRVRTGRAVVMLVSANGVRRYALAFAVVGITWIFTSFSTPTHLCLHSHWSRGLSGRGGGGGYRRPVDRGAGAWTAETVKRPLQQPAHPQHANHWAPLTRKRHTMPHSAQPQHANYWAPRTWKRHQQEHRPQQPTESSDPTQHAKGRTGDCPGPRKGTTTRRNVTRRGGVKQTPSPRVTPSALGTRGPCSAGLDAQRTSEGLPE